MKLEEIKCSSCGHVNAPGTQLCQSCGRLINKDYDKKKIKDLMRYDGSAVRSKVKSQSIFDKIWIFFTSIKVGVAIIAIIAIAAAIGTIFPQQYFIPVGADPETYYLEHYGTLGYLYYQLGFHNLYSSWWFLILNGMLALSIIAASIDRGVPLHKSLKNQRAKKHQTYFKRQRLHQIHDAELSNEQFENIKSQFKQKGYKLTEDGNHALLEKGRLSRWGPYINHTGLIIILLGSMLRFFPNMYIDEIVYIQEGDIVPLPTTNNEYYIENHRFVAENYDIDENPVFNQALQMANVTQNFQTDITFYRNNNRDIVGSSPELEPIEDYSIRVNHPYRFDNYELYQSSFDSSRMKSMSFHIEDESGEVIGDTFTVLLDNPDETYVISDDMEVRMRAYSPDFLEISDSGALVSATPVPRNPAFVFEVRVEGEDPELSMIQVMGNTPITQGNDYTVRFNESEQHIATVLTLKKDLTIPFFAVGFGIFLLGLFIGSYINHRRIWLTNEDSFMAAGHTNKNYFGLKKDINSIFHANHLDDIYDKFDDEETFKKNTETE